MKLASVKINAIDEHFAPGHENLDFTYSICPAGFSAASVKAEVFMGEETTPLFTFHNLPVSGTVNQSWDGKDDTGAFVTPTNYTVKVSATWTEYPGMTNSATANTAVEVHSVELCSDRIYDGEKVDMSFTDNNLDNHGLTDFNALVKLKSKTGAGVPTPVPFTVYFTASEGLNNVAKDDAFKYNPPLSLGKKSDPDAKYWKETQGKSIMAASPDNYHFNANGRTITDTNDPDLGKSFMTLLPSGVGGDTFTLDAVVTRTDNTIPLATTSTNLTVWRKVKYDQVRLMTNADGTNETHVVDYATKMLIQPFLDAAFVEYEINMSNTTVMSQTDSLKYIGLHPLHQNGGWEIKLGIETPDDQIWFNATNTVPNFPAQVRLDAKNEIKTKAQAWTTRIAESYILTRRSWAATIPDNTIVTIQYYHPKYSHAAQNWQTREWGDGPYDWLKVTLPGSTIERDPDGWWGNVGGTSWGRGVVTMPKGFGALTPRLTAHETCHASRFHFWRELFDSTTTGRTDHSPPNTGLMDPSGSQPQLNETEVKILKGESTK